jgi:hypothetical protein
MSAPTIIDIVNSALIRLGVEHISSLVENSKRARVMNSLYNICRRRLLEDHLWNFAIKRATLLQTNNTPLFGYQYEYQLPSDFLRLVEERDDGSFTFTYHYPVSSSYPIYEIEGDKVLTDKESFEIIYVYDSTEVYKFSPYFIKALYLELAAEASYSITQNPALTSDIRQEKEAVLSIARSIGSGQDRSDENVDPNDFVVIRGVKA